MERDRIESGNRRRGRLDSRPDDLDVTELPEWWSKNIEEFESYELPPYRPPRFADGELVTEYVNSLEASLSVSIDIRAMNPQDGNEWQIRVGGEPVETINRVRKKEGFSMYDIASSEFETAVRNATIVD